MEEVNIAIKSLKSGKAADIDEIRPEMLQLLNPNGIKWLTRVCSVAWKIKIAPIDWQHAIIIPVFKEDDQRECSNYKGISLLRLPGKVFARILERRCRVIVEPIIEDNQCGFRAGRGTTDQLFILQQLFEKCWKFGRPLYTAFIDFEKAYDKVLRYLLWKVLIDYSINGHILATIQSLYNHYKCCVRINGIKSDWFNVNGGLRQGCILSPLLFIIFMDNISRRSTTPDGMELNDVKVQSLLFADDIARLTSAADRLQEALDHFETECSSSGMKINANKIEVLVLSRQPGKCNMHLNGRKLKQVDRFKYLGLEYSSDRKQDGEIDPRIGMVSEIIRSLHRTMITKNELSLKTKLAIFKSVYRPTLIYGHEQWVISERIQSRLKATEIRFLRKVAGFSLRDKVQNNNIRKKLPIEPLLLDIERSQLHRLGHVLRIRHNRLPSKILQATFTCKRPIKRPRTTWRKYIEPLYDE